MPQDPQPRNSRQCSPRKLARKIESCIFRNALDEEERAQKALYLLQARDRRIAFLEKRVVELEGAAANLHELALRGSSRAASSKVNEEIVSSFCTSEKSCETRIMDKCNDSTMNRDSVTNDRLSVPRLRLSKSSTSTSERDIFATAIDFALEKRKRFASNTTVSSENSASSKLSGRNEKFHAKTENRAREEKIATVDNLDSTSALEKNEEAALNDRKGNITVNEVISESYSKLSTENDKTKSIERQTVDREQTALQSPIDAQGTRLIADKKPETKTISTQTTIEAVHSKEKTVRDSNVETDANHFVPSFAFERKKLPTYWGVDEDPAPQWLIEEALARGEQRTKGNVSSNKEVQYETIVSELEAKLAKTREDLEEALEAKSIVREKYRKSLENLKIEARKEREVLQERIVQICTSVFENFGPRSMDGRRSCGYQVKSRKKLKYHERITRKLRRKLQMAVARSNKLKLELMAARKTLKQKSEEYESIRTCFDQLKREMDATETNLNDLIAENLSLRRKMDDTRDWLRNTVGKERDALKNRELTNLKKKVEEDSNTISQLKDKLVRTESTNANKGFLLNSYKSQLKELSKEKDQLLSKINSLETEISNVRSSNSQLKAKISILNCEKDKLHSDNEKSKTSITGKMETRLAKKCEETVQQETEAIKAKYDETVKSMKTTVQQETEAIKAKYDESIRSIKIKLTAAKNLSTEYANAIKEFLRKLYEHEEDHESQKSSNETEASEREAQETACTILNMTPEELCGFINGKTKNSTNPWIVELSRITARSNFSKELSKFLLKKATKKTKT
ncbi:uncharacterized protein LOC143422370 [Xylocopa sonorina]|uniref:uncharacterized protein LOC143422370 n=1 Tax=Xylocopa sonorina TaxID=1818115 RepID=UPI00403A87BF